MSGTVDTMIDEYVRWLRANITVGVPDRLGWAKVRTPFLDASNDELQVYVRQEADGSFVISDGEDLDRIASKDGFPAQFHNVLLVKMGMLEPCR